MENSKIILRNQNAYQNKKAIRSEDINTGEILYFHSNYRASKHFGVNPCIIYLLCKNTNKLLNKSVKFSYTTIPNDDTVKIIKKIPKFTEEEKKQNLKKYCKKYNDSKKQQKLLKTNFVVVDKLEDDKIKPLNECQNPSSSSSLDS